MTDLATLFARLDRSHPEPEREAAARAITAAVITADIGYVELVAAGSETADEARARIVRELARWGDVEATEAGFQVATVSPWHRVALVVREAHARHETGRKQLGAAKTAEAKRAKHDPAAEARAFLDGGAWKTSNLKTQEQARLQAGLRVLADDADYADKVAAFRAKAGRRANCDPAWLG